jgi:hypothetical protein
MEASTTVRGSGTETGGTLEAASEKAREQAGKVAGGLEKGADTAKGKLAERATEMQKELRSLADTVKEEQPTIGEPIEAVVQRSDALVNYLEQTPVSEILQDGIRWAKRHPGASLAAFAGVGFAIGRLARPADSPTGGSQQRLDSYSNRPAIGTGGGGAAVGAGGGGAGSVHGRSGQTLPVAPNIGGGPA